MIIGIDAGCLGIKDKRLKVGVFQLAKTLLQNLAKIDKKNKYILYSFNPIDREVIRLFGKNFENKVLISKAWLSLQLPFAILKDKIDVFLGVSQVIPKPLPFSSRPYTIGFVYDLAFEKFPEMYKGSYKNLSRNTRYLVKNADKIIAISNSSKKDIEIKYKVFPSKISVFYPGIGSPSRCDAGATPPGRWDTPYFLFVGALKPIKNVPTVIRAFRVFCEILKQVQNDKKEKYLLYLVGGDKWVDSEIKETLQTVPKEIREKIKFFGFVNDSELRNLYKNAIAFVSPSFYEGFGFPILEAMSFSCPVISSKEGSIPEVVGDAGLLFDSVDIRGIGEAMIKISKDKNLREELAKKGLTQAKKFSLEKFAKEVLEVINVPKPEK